MAGLELHRLLDDVALRAVAEVAVRLRLLVERADRLRREVHVALRVEVVEERKIGFN